MKLYTAPPNHLEDCPDHPVAMFVILTSILVGITVAFFTHPIGAAVALFALLLATAIVSMPARIRVPLPNHSGDSPDHPVTDLAVMTSLLAGISMAFFTHPIGAAAAFVGALLLIAITLL